MAFGPTPWISSSSRSDRSASWANLVRPCTASSRRATLPNDAGNSVESVVDPDTFCSPGWVASAMGAAFLTTACEHGRDAGAARRRQQDTAWPDDVVCDETHVQNLSSMAYADFSCGLLSIGSVGLRRIQR